jgi:hypothetical protein
MEQGRRLQPVARQASSRPSVDVRAERESRCLLHRSAWPAAVLSSDSFSYVIAFSPDLPGDLSHQFQLAPLVVHRQQVARGRGSEATLPADG